MSTGIALITLGTTAINAATMIVATTLVMGVVALREFKKE
jgi:hypothetical protein